MASTAPARTTAIVKLEMTQTVYLEVDVDPYDMEDGEVDPKELMERATAAIYDGARPETASAGIKGLAAWVRGAPCRPKPDPYTSFQRCETHGDLMGAGASECWEVDSARYVGMEDERPQVAPSGVGGTDG